MSKNEYVQLSAEDIERHRRTIAEHTGCSYDDVGHAFIFGHVFHVRGSKEYWRPKEDVEARGLSGNEHE